MSTTQSRRNKAKVRSLVFGALSISLYAAVFMNSQAILHYCAKGGFHNVVPVAMVFLFSYIHGSFASNTWSALGIEASSTAIKKAEKTTETRPDAAVRPRAVVQH